MFALNDV